ncbi:hypothetical protein, partial [Pseudomonas aeruginosa]|uniref:hypothetical protein n=1 Tax=Pseudomonas aeruginosa TaxID=287 RepID=UPI0022312E24
TFRPLRPKRDTIGNLQRRLWNLFYFNQTASAIPGVIQNLSCRKRKRAESNKLKPRATLRQLRPVSRSKAATPNLRASNRRTPPAKKTMAKLNSRRARLPSHRNLLRQR